MDSQPPRPPSSSPPPPQPGQQQSQPIQPTSTGSSKGGKLVVFGVILFAFLVIGGLVLSVLLAQARDEDAASQASVEEELSLEDIMVEVTDDPDTANFPIVLPEDPTNFDEVAVIVSGFPVFQSAFDVDPTAIAIVVRNDGRAKCAVLDRGPTFRELTDREWEIFTPDQKVAWDSDFATFEQYNRALITTYCPDLYSD